MSSGILKNMKKNRLGMFQNCPPPDRIRDGSLSAALSAGGAGSLRWDILRMNRRYLSLFKD